MTALAVQGDGKIVVGGQFLSFNDGSGANTKVNKLARFTADGALDTAFTASYAGTATGLNNSVYSVAVQGDGRIVVGGSFFSYNNGSGANSKVSKLARFTADGSLDTSFTNSYAGSATGLGDEVYSLAVQSDAKIVVGGAFHDYDDGSGPNPKVNHLARFNGTSGTDHHVPQLAQYGAERRRPGSGGNSLVGFAGDLYLRHSCRLHDLGRGHLTRGHRELHDHGQPARQ